MFRAKWTTVLVAALSCAGPILAQQPASSCPRVVTIQEEGKPALQCRVLKTWPVGNGVAFEVEVLATGERITLVESDPVNQPAGGGKIVREARSKFYHWVHHSPPPGAPMAPPDAIVSGNPTMAQVPTETPTSTPAPVTQVVAPPTPPGVVTPAVNSTPMATATSVSPKPAAAVTPAASSTTVATLPPASPPPPAAVAPAAPKVAPAQPSDWHQSWGKADDHKGKTDDPKVAADPAAQPPSHMPAKTELPQASTEGKDPLADPETFSPYHLKHKDDVVGIQVTPGEGVAKKNDGPEDDPLKLDDEPKKDTVATGDTPKKADAASKTDAGKPGDKVAAAPAKAPEKKPDTSVRLTERFKNFLGRKDRDKLKTPANSEEAAGKDDGMGSVMAACQAAGMPMPTPGMVPSSPTPPTLADTDPSNAFTTVVRKSPAKPKKPAVSADEANAFDSSRPTPPYQVAPGIPPGRPPMPPRGYAGIPPTPPGYAGMTPPPGAVPMPAYAQAPPPPGVMPAGYVQPPPMMDRGPSTPPMTSAPAPAADPSQLLLILRSSLFPSNREWAADQLGNPEWRSSPAVVEMLLQSAKNDPAPTVRASCVRNLANMNANMPTVVEALTALQKDENEGVRKEVTRTLSKLQSASAPGSVRTPIQPASMR